jgi:hypothetical protein
MRDSGTYGNREGLVKPINIEDEHKIGNNGRHHKNPPIGKKNDIP